LFYNLFIFLFTGIGATQAISEHALLDNMDPLDVSIRELLAVVAAEEGGGGGGPPGLGMVYILYSTYI